MKCFTNSLTQVCFLLDSFSALHLVGQNQLLYWGLPDSYYDFSGNSISSLPTSTNNPNGPWGYEGEDVVPSNMIYDDAGDLIFFIANNAVYDSDGKLIGAFILTSNNWTRPGASNAIEILDEVTIVPIDKCSNKFHIIANRSKTNTSARTTAGVLWYTLDMNESWNEPDLAPNGKLLFNDELVSPTCTGIHCGYSGIAVSPQRTDGSYFLYTFSYEGFQKFDINGNNITEDNNFDTGLYNISNQSGTYASEAELYYNEEDGSYKFAYVARPGERNSTVTIWNLDSDGMADFSNDPPIELNPFASLTDPDEHSLGENVTGLEFSPDGEKLFLTATDENNTGISAIQYIDLSANPATLNDFSVSNENQYRFSFIELGQDGKIYIPGTTAIASLSSPNSPNTANWTASEINFAAPTKNDLNNLYPNRNYRLLPDQIDGQNYDNIVPIGYNAINYTATTSATWTPGAGSNPFGSTTGIVYISNTLIIPKGIDIEIQNMDFRFGPEGRIIIENGNGTLEGGELTLTNTICQANDVCEPGSTWKGIEVWGNPNQLNFGGLSGGSRRFGSILVQSSSQIKDAEIGILAASRLFGVPTNARTGGLVEVKNSTFTNCKSGIVLHPHKYFNYSYIENNTFTINDSYDHTAQPENHIKLKDVGVGKGIPISGNTIQELRTSFSNTTDRINGIWSENSVFTAANNNFNDLEYGIRATAIIKSRTFSATDNTFDGNYHGAYTRGINNFIFRDNDLFINGPFFISYGAYFIDGSNFEIQRNLFEQNADAVTYSVGLVIQNSGSIDYNRISRNDFTDLYIATWALEDNGEADMLGIGLEMLCGTYTNCTVDFYVPSGSMINPIQGSCKDGRPAGNTFSKNCSTGFSDSDYWLGTGTSTPSVVEYEHANYAPETPECFTETKLRDDKCIFLTTATNCEEDTYHGITAGMTYVQMEAKYDTAVINYNNASDSLTEAFYKSEMNWLADRIAIAYYSDTLSGNIDSAISWFDKGSRFHKTAPILIESNQLIDASISIDSIDANYSFDSTYISYYNLLVDMQTDTLLPSDLDSNNISDVEIWADDSTIQIQGLAKNMLEMARGDYYEDTLDVPTDTSAKRNNSKIAVPSVWLYPNPASNSLMVNTSSMLDETIVITIFDNTGQQVLVKVVSTAQEWYKLTIEHLNQGIHLISLTSNMGELKVSKFVKLN